MVKVCRAAAWCVAASVASAGMGCATSPPAGAIVAIGGDLPANHVVVDATAVYWPDRVGGTNGIFRVSLDAMDAMPTLVVDTGQAADKFAVDASSVYWVAEGFSGPTSAIMSAPLGGGTPVMLANGLYGPDGLVVDETRAYWADSHSVLAVSLTGGQVQHIADEQASRVLVRNRHAYWSTGNAIRSLDLSDPAATPTTVVTSYVASFAVDDTNVYWLTFDPSGCGVQPVHILEAPLGGGATRTLLDSTADLGSFFMPLEVDATAIYWSDDHTITRIGIDGNAVRAVANAPDGLDAFALGTSDVYFGAIWRDASAQVVRNGIRRVPKD